MIELLAPAGDLEKFKIAIEYGADAVYFGGEIGGLRAAAGNLSVESIKEAVVYAHTRGKQAYLTMNIYAHNEDIEPLRRYLEQIKGIPIDAFIVSDPGVISLIKEYIPDATLHLSTQSNTTNKLTAKFWYDQGVRRLVLARELTLKEIREIRDAIPSDMELEAFVHGAMCISYSGRCLLSNALNDRDSNRGECSQPCRWKYSLVEEQRPGEFYPIEEDERGTYIMNSKDICMIENISDLIDAGITSFKIEGRMKSLYYVATVVGAYRRAIDEGYQQNHLEELMKASHRDFCTGFFYNKPREDDARDTESSGYNRGYDFVGLVKGYDPETRLAEVEQRNKMVVGDKVEVFGPGSDLFEQTVGIMLDDERNPIESAPHAQQTVFIEMAEPVEANYIIRKSNCI